MSQALYRKYRSRAFDDVVGQEHITSTLARAIEAGHISHAYLFTGPHGTGKTSVARILAHAINDLPYSDATNLDIIEIDAASNRRIDDIRDLREKVHIAPIAAKYKVYIIDEVHMLTGESFNALLKTLEEPPAHVVFILATTEAHKLPATIISRAQRFTFKAASADSTMSLLKAIATKEKLAISDEALALIAEHGGGGFRDGVSLLDQMAHVSISEITIEDVRRTLGLAPREAMDSLVNALLAGDHTTTANSLSDLEAQGSSPSALVQQLVQVLSERAQTSTQLYTLIDQLLDVPRAYNPGLKLLSTLMVFASAQKPAIEGSDPPSPANTQPATPQKPSLQGQTSQSNTKPQKPVLQGPSLQKQDSPIQDSPKKTRELAAKGESKAIDSKLESLSPGQWVKVLKAIKKANAPVFSVIKQAQPTFDPQKHTLTLGFKYKLHQKKMDDAKVKAAITSLMQDVLGATATLVSEHDPKATPPVMSDDPTVSSVAAIMGGGEVVNAKEV